jgi:hypothetical protein
MMGNMMGFRPLGYAEGGIAMDDQTRAAIVDYIMSTTGDTSDSIAAALFGLPDEDLLMARQRVEENALAAQQQKMMQTQQSSPTIPDFPGVVPNNMGGYDYYPPETGMERTLPPTMGVPPEGGDQMLIPRTPAIPAGAGVGIMSLGRR